MVFVVGGLLFYSLQVFVLCMFVICLLVSWFYFSLSLYFSLVLHSCQFLAVFSLKCLLLCCVFVYRFCCSTESFRLFFAQMNSKVTRKCPFKKYIFRFSRFLFG